MIALLTDFGLSDWYVGAVKGVILGLNPGAAIVDITHSVPPQDIAAASFALLASRGAFPQGTIFCVIVDPGVGMPRKIVCLRSGGRLYLAPDNGVLTEVVAEDGVEAAASVEERSFFREPTSATFHGRDIFAPVAARLSLGLAIERLGPRLDRITMIEMPKPQVGSDSAEIPVRWVDAFGNVITGCSEDLLRQLRGSWGDVVAEAGGVRIPIRETYGVGAPGELVGLVGSSHRLEISVRGGSAAARFGLAIGDKVTLRKG